MHGGILYKKLLLKTLFEMVNYFKKIGNNGEIIKELMSRWTKLNVTVIAFILLCDA